MNNTIMSKQERYAKLVERRKACGLCLSTGLTNPSKCEGGAYDQTGHIGPWTQWQGNLNARVMVIAQDWGGKDYYVKHKGLEEDNNATNRQVCKLLESVNIQIRLPRETQDDRPLFFTNAVLCLKRGLLTGSVKSSWFNNCGSAFLRPQVELVNPKVVVTLGYRAYDALMKAYARPRKALMREAVKSIEELPGGSVLVPVYHPGNNGTRSRSKDDQKNDWQRVRNALES